MKMYSVVLINKVAIGLALWLPMLGVGSNHKKKKFTIELAIKDKDHLKKMCRFLQRQEAAVRDKDIFRDGKVYHECVLEVGNKKIVRDLVDNFNIVQAKSLILQPPIKVPGGLIKDFVRGFFDGDGCISKSKYDLPVFNITSHSKDMLDWLRKTVALESNIPFSIWASMAIGVGGVKADAVFNWLYSDSTPETRLDRKYERYLEYCK